MLAPRCCVSGWRWPSIMPQQLNSKAEEFRVLAGRGTGWTIRHSICGGWWKSYLNEAHWTVLLLGEIVFEFWQLWIRQCQALCSIVSDPSGIDCFCRWVFSSECGAQSQTHFLAQEKGEKKVKKSAFSLLGPSLLSPPLLPPAPRLIHILCSSMERMLFLKEI